jgi:pSer/pThr/pTyr-binding forkhead associated (FHA) protein
VLQWRVLLERLAPEAEPIRLHPPAMREGESRVLGRDSTCDYAIPDPTVSHRHAEIRRVEGGWAIRDLGSRNGTRINGWLAHEERIRPGDTLTLGTTEFVFEPLSVRSPE